MSVISYKTTRSLIRIYIVCQDILAEYIVYLLEVHHV